jgi:ribose 5-phosphate isomerase A
MLSPKYIEQFLEHKIKPNYVISIGTSKTAYKVVKELALKDILNDLKIKLVPTTLEIGHLATEYNLKLANGNEKIDLVIEFANAVDPLFNYAKKDTQSLIRDKIIAYHAKEVIVFVEKSNVNQQIIEFPIEVAKFGIEKTLNALQSFGNAKIRLENEQPLKTINQNNIIDLKTNKIYSYDDLEYRIKEIPGVLETGLFINLADKIYSVENKKIEKVVDLINR